MSLTAKKSGFLPEQDGHRVYWESYGNAAGEPLLLVHGGTGYVFDTPRLTALDPARQHIIVLHRRGTGNSLPRGEIAHNGVMDNLRDMERLRKHLRLPAWSIFSWSAGAVLMAAYAARHPGRCRTLTAYAPYLGSEDGYDIIRRKDPAAAVRYFGFHNAKTGAEVVRSVFNKAADPDRAIRLKTAFAAASVWTPGLDEQQFYNSKSPAAWDDHFAIYKLGAVQDLELHTQCHEFLARTPVSAPVTLVYGENDLWSGPHEYADAVFPHAQKFMINDTGHDVHDIRVQNKLPPLTPLPAQMEPRPPQP